MAHIEVEEEIQRKKVNEQPKQLTYKESEREFRQKDIEAPSIRQSDQRYIPYVAKTDDMKEQFDSDLPQPRFRKSYRSLMTKKDVVDKLRFHQARGCDTLRCLTLSY